MSAVITAGTEHTSRRITVPTRTTPNATTGRLRETSIPTRDGRVQKPMTTTTTTAGVLRDIRRAAVFRATGTVCAVQTAFTDHTAKAPDFRGLFVLFSSFSATARATL